MTRTQKIVIAALAAIAAAIIPFWTHAPETWGLDNTAPVINTPTSTSLEYLFPRGEKAVLQFGSEPVTDDDGDTATPRFVFTVPNVDTTDNADTIETDNEADVLFKIRPNGHNFEFTAKDMFTPEDFTNLYGNVMSYLIPVKMYATANSQDSEPLEFTITAYHDASPQFHHSATYQSKQRWELKRSSMYTRGPRRTAS